MNKNVFEAIQWKNFTSEYQKYLNKNILKLLK